MSRPSSLFALLVTGIAVLSGIGCAMSSPADLSPSATDPSLPGVDVGSDPTPVPGAKSAEAGTGTTPSTTPDAGSKSTAAPDSGAPPVDPGPSIPKPSATEIFITEIMYDTFGAEPASEWVELHSVAASARTLSGLTLKDGSGRTHTIAGSVTIAPGAYVLLARDKATAIGQKVPAAAIVYEYGTGLPDNAGILLTNGATGGVSLLNGATTLASVPYGGWYSQSGGSSVQLKVLDPAQASVKASWCLSLTAWTTGSEKGTPGAAEDCP